MPHPDYSAADIIDALRQVGVRSGETLFIHANIGFFGTLAAASSARDYYRLYKQSLQGVLGADGTYCVPTFSYSFCRGGEFDVQTTPSVCGVFTQWVRQDAESYRSADANFSVAAVGRKAAALTADAPAYSFGPGTFWEKFLEADGKICNFNFDSGSTLIHYIERELRVPYRYDKPFSGMVITPTGKEPQTFYHFVYDKGKPQHAPNFAKLDRLAKEKGLTKTANLGKGQVVAISARDLYNLIRSCLLDQPSLLIRGEI